MNKGNHEIFTYIKPVCVRFLEAFDFQIRVSRYLFNFLLASLVATLILMFTPGLVESSLANQVQAPQPVCRGLFVIDRINLKLISPVRLKKTVLQISSSSTGPVGSIAAKKSSHLKTMADAYQSAAKLSALLQSQSNPIFDGPFDRVLYPASGEDSATPFIAFPNVKVVFGFDLFPFSNGRDSKIQARFDRGEYNKSRGVELYRDIRKREYLAPGLLGSILSISSKIRILEVESFHDESLRSHGVIHFDEGPGTPLRAYVHIQSPNGLAPPFGNLQWIRPNALFIKGSMNFYDPVINFHNWMAILKMLEMNTLIVDGDDVIKRYLRIHSQLYSRVVSVETGISKLGYSETMVYKVAPPLVGESPQ